MISFSLVYASEQDDSGFSLPGNVEVYVDSSSSINITDIESVLFKPMTPEERLGIGNNNHSNWYKLKIDSSNNPEVLYIDQANIDSIWVYQKTGDGSWVTETTGKKYPFSNRSIINCRFIIPINPMGTGDLYIKVKSKYKTSFNFITGSYRSVLNHENNLTILFVLALGVILAMIGYNTFIFISVKERVYFIYVIQSFLTAILQVVLIGQSLQWFWPNQVWIQDYAIVFFTSISTLSGLVFMVSFLKTKKYTPIFHKLSIGFIGLYTILTILSCFVPSFVHGLLLGLQPVIALFILSVATLVIIRGYKPAKFYLFAWVTFLVGILVFVLAEIGVVERSMFTILAIPFGAAIEVVFLSLALANRINILKKEQENAVSNSFRLEKEKATLIQEQNLILEQKVKERTTQLKNINFKLEEKNLEIENALAGLKSAQSQLVNAEKMSSLGQLTAGVAHEINNPINFVSSNVAPLKRDVGDLVFLFEETEKLLNKYAPNEVITKVKAIKEEIEYSYLREEIDHLLKGMKDGANRTVEIIRGLKLFSRIDENDLKKVNLEEGLKATLVLLNSHLKHHINVVTNFSGVPPVDCYGGKMNQVFMNILTNAIHAIDETKRNDGELIISTKTDGTNVVISIADNGAGIPEEIKNKLYEPFFTTKPVGKGTGLGLSIVFTIIEKINGTITLNSEVGKGTEFLITLPITNTN
ncbi:MAG: sensor histidine kinase [Salibacteraceae bacterium]